jgi:protein-tyrosine phosphatase
MPEVLDWRRAEPREVLRRVVQVLAEGGLVAFPTETVYAVAADARQNEAVQRLPFWDQEEFTPLAVRGAADLLDWVPGISRLGRRLSRRCWPGPVTLVFGEGVEGGLASRLPEGVRQRLGPRGTLAFRVPAHEAILRVLRQVAAPLVLGTAGSAEEPVAISAEHVVRRLGDAVRLVIDDGPARYGQEASVVQVQGKNWQLLREGVVPADLIERLTPCRVVFVCTGNTCRSPLAEALCKKMLAERLQCPPTDLARQGFEVVSAGLAAPRGSEAAAEAVEVARELGADLSGHQSQPLTADLLTQADYLVTMTRSHLRALAEHAAAVGLRPRLLSREGHDLPDPIGGDQAVYRECAQQILHQLADLVSELQQ